MVKPKLPPGASWGGSKTIIVYRENVWFDPSPHIPEVCRGVGIKAAQHIIVLAGATRLQERLSEFRISF